MVQERLTPMETCPGCGASLPASDRTMSPSEYLANDSCLAFAEESLGFEWRHQSVLGRWHQLRVDTYGAQHSGPDTKAITTFFALNGLYMHLERGSGNVAVRTAHGIMANSGTRFPRFQSPATWGPTSVQDLAAADSPDEWATVLQAWAAEVWSAWPEDVRAVVRDITDRLVPPRWIGDPS